MKKLIAGYMGLTKASWKTPKIKGIMDSAVKSLSKLPIELVCDKELTTTEDDAISLCEKFNSSNVDIVIMHFASFPLGAIIPAVASRIKVPVILFANPESPEEGGIWSQNSFCGSNMAAHVLKKLGLKYYFAWGKADEAAEKVESVLKVFKAVKGLKNTKLGLIGGRVPGFYTSNFDEMKLRAFAGTTVEVLDLAEVFNEAKKLSPEASAEGLAALKKNSCGTCAVSDEELKLAGNLYQAFLKIADKYKFDGLAIRCWPEFSDIYGIAPCAVIGMLNNAGIPSSCEGDIPGAFAMQIQKQFLPDSIPVFMDLISFDYKENTAVVWHCGAAPASLCRKFDETVLRKHGRVDGGDKKGVTNDFSLKAGRVTLIQFNETKEGYRMLIAAGNALDTDKFIRGNPLNIRFDGSVEKLIGTIINEGLEHHYSIVYGDIKDELIAFCKEMKIETLIIE